MKVELQSGTSDNANWLKENTLTDDERKKLIEDKLKRGLNQIELNRKVPVTE